MKNFINISDIPANDLRKILKDAKIRKNKRKKFKTLQRDIDTPLKDKLLIQMYEKESLRTRLSFLIAIKQLGGEAINIRANELHLGKGGERLSDTAKILSTYCDAFMLRTDNDEKIFEFNKNLKIPFINLLSPSSHPCQVLSDIFTIEEIKKKKISKLHISWIGDSNNVLNSLISAALKFKFNLNIGCPKKYRPSKMVANKIKLENRIFFFESPKKAILDADVIFSDKFVSLNDKVNKLKKIRDFKSYKIDSKLIKYAKRNAIFLHCLPRGDEVSDDVFLGKQSHVWQQALNRVHVQKSILLYCFGKLR